MELPSVASSIGIEPLTSCSVGSLLFSRLGSLLDEIETEELSQDALMGEVVRGLAAILLYHFTSVGSCRGFVVQTFQKKESKKEDDECGCREHARECGHVRWPLSQQSLDWQREGRSKSKKGLETRDGGPYYILSRPRE